MLYPAPPHHLQEVKFPDHCPPLRSAFMDFTFSNAAAASLGWGKRSWQINHAKDLNGGAGTSQRDQTCSQVPVVGRTGGLGGMVQLGGSWTVLWSSGCLSNGDESGTPTTYTPLWHCSCECCGYRVWYQLPVPLLILQKPKDRLFQPAPCGSTRLEYQCCRVTSKKVPR